jgi:hypothetical protein
VSAGTDGAAPRDGAVARPEGGLKVSGGEAATPLDPSSSLDSLKALTDPTDATDDSARDALRAVSTLLPKLTRKADSVAALYYAALARLHFDDAAGACRILRSIRNDAATANLSRAVDALFSDPQVGCRAAGRDG